MTRNKTQRSLDAPVSKTVTTAARRLARMHNADDVTSGYIYQVNLHTGWIGALVATYAVKQIDEDSVLYGDYAYLRISYGRMTQAEAQRFINDKGQDW